MLLLQSRTGCFKKEEGDGVFNFFYAGYSTAEKRLLEEG
jgi:hypothetical protein